MEPPDKYKNWRLAVCCVIFVLVLLAIYLAQTLAYEPFRGHIAYSRLFLEASTNPDISISLIIGKLIDCESGGNPLAIGKAGEIGILQFMPQTFQAFCVDRYNLEDKIYKSEIQIKCCRKMLEQNLGFHWTCYDPKMSI